MFSERFKQDELRRMIVPRDQFRPFPAASDRDAWEALPSELHEDRIRLGEVFVGYDWPSLSATRFLQFSRTGDRQEFESVYHERRRALSALVVAECLEGKGSFLDDIVNGIWCLCEETSWILPAHNYLGSRTKAEDPSESLPALPDVTDHVIDLAAGETAGLLTWTHYLLRAKLDGVSDVVSARIRHEINQRILAPFLLRDDFWWMGFDPGRHTVNNWNPWCNANCLLAFLLLEDDADRRNQAVDKVMRSLDHFIAGYHADGGCDEGTTYWDKAGGMLFDCLELLFRASNGKINFYEEPLIREMGRFIYRSHIHEDYFINFADGSARVNLSANLVYRYGRQIGDAKLMAIGSYAHHSRSDKSRRQARDFPTSLTRQLPALFDYAEMQTAACEPPYERDVWFSGIQVMAAREEVGHPGGLYLAAKGGHNNESHNHNDVGQFIVYADGQPVLIDIGVETYTAKTFSNERYEIWTMQSCYHNLPIVNGVQQGNGLDYKASAVDYRCEEEKTELSMDITQAYPAKAGIKKWHRRFGLNRTDTPFVEVTDSFELNQKTDDIVLSLMTPSPHRFKSDMIVLDNGNSEVYMQMKGPSLSMTSEKIDIHDEKLIRVWGNHLYRILLRTSRPLDQGKWIMQISQTLS